MREKGASFVRVPGLTPRESAQLQQEKTPMTQQAQMQAAQPEDKARSRLLEHRSTLISLWGAGFESDPRFESAVHDVRKGRHPANVIADFSGS
jgi:hypothetical protein